jgi:hypothetical protein
MDMIRNGHAAAKRAELMNLVNNAVNFQEFYSGVKVISSLQAYEMTACDFKYGNTK